MFPTLLRDLVTSGGPRQTQNSVSFYDLSGPLDEIVNLDDVRESGSRTLSTSVTDLHESQTSNMSKYVDVFQRDIKSYTERTNRNSK